MNCRTDERFSRNWTLCLSKREFINTSQYEGENRKSELSNLSSAISNKGDIAYSPHV